MVAEDDEAVFEPPEQPSQLGLAARARKQVAAHQHQVGLALADPIDGFRDGVMAARGKAEMKVADVTDAQTVQLLRQARDRSVQFFQPHPAGFEDAPTERGQEQPSERYDEPDHHSSTSGEDSFASTLPSGTTWRES